MERARIEASNLSCRGREKTRREERCTCLLEMGAQFTTQTIVSHSYAIYHILVFILQLETNHAS